MRKSISTINYLFFSIMALLIGCSQNNSDRSDKIKTEKATKFYYKMGIPEPTGKVNLLTKYNEFGNEIEEINYNSDGIISSKRLFQYENDTLLSSETEYGIDGKIWYKKNIKYRNNGKKDLIQIYSTFSTTNSPELTAQMKFIYNHNGDICEKRYFGEIDYMENELHGGIFSNGLNDNATIRDREHDREKDSMTARYYYNKDKKIDCIYFNNDSSLLIKYIYDTQGRITSRIACFSEKETQKGGPHLIFVKHFNIGDGKFFQYLSNNEIVTKEIIDRRAVIRHFNADKKITETKWYSERKDLLRKIKFNYENGILKEAISYSKIEEPEFIEKYEYTFY